MVQYPNSNLTTIDGTTVLAQKIQTSLVSTDDTDSGKVITPVEIKALPNLSQVKACIRIEPFFSVLFEYLTFDLQARFGNLH